MTKIILYLMAAAAALASACAVCLTPGKPSVAQVEATAMRANAGHRARALRCLRDWAQSGVPAAERELALIERRNPVGYADARRLFEDAGTRGDGEAAFQMGAAFHDGTMGVARNPDRAWKWYRQSAQYGDARAALMLARLAKYGEGIGRDPRLSASWLTFASEHGNAQAMFLLSNSYQSGDGVPRNALMARRWLELSADHEYPVAIQALAMAVQGGDMLMVKNQARARHLLKEAGEERRNRWNSYD